MKDGFIKIAASAPDIKTCDVPYNAEQILIAMQRAYEQNVSMLSFPALTLTGVDAGSLYLNESLMKSVQNGINTILNATIDMEMILIMGSPTIIESNLYSAAIVMSKGKIIGVIPQNNSKNSAFCKHIGEKHCKMFEHDVYFGDSLTFCHRDICDFSFSVSFSDATHTINLANQNANIVFDLCDKEASVGMKEEVCESAKALSRLCHIGLIKSYPSYGQSSSDNCYNALRIICENGAVLDVSDEYENDMTVSEIDVRMLNHEKHYSKITAPKSGVQIYFPLDMPQNTSISRYIRKNPFLPDDIKKQEKRCFEIIELCSHALVSRLTNIGCKKVVIGLSGGLDSTFALIIAVRAFDILDLAHDNIITISMPSFGTGKRTHKNSELLAQAYRVSFEHIDITGSVLRHFEDINQDISNKDVTFENAQARMRTMILMDIANKNSAIVLGTGDLSECALGFATYNGDHMSMYGVNSSVTKTTIQKILYFEALRLGDDIGRTILDVVNTPISPELLPPDEHGRITQKTEDIVGPYELHDFYLYYLVRYGFAPEKIYRLAVHAFGGVYDGKTIKKWLREFLKRFFANQFKRTCMPDGPKISDVTLSPRGGFLMPSDLNAKVFIDAANNINVKERG